jgi:mRNA-degrading endonuclease RelE of RelBE toxin-antitoxin system
VAMSSADEKLAADRTEIERPAASVRLTPQAEAELKAFSLPTRAILSRAIRDQLLEPSGWRGFKRVEANTDQFELGIGNFRIRFQPLNAETGQLGGEDRLVDRIYRAE